MLKTILVGRPRSDMNHLLPLDVEAELTLAQGLASRRALGRLVFRFPGTTLSRRLLCFLGFTFSDSRVFILSNNCESNWARFLSG